MQEKIAIYETAFVTSSFRAGNESLSKDSFAKLWLTEKTEGHARHYSNKVSSYEPFAHCLRNRFFLEKIGSYAKKGEIELLINFGCGFSMYPFLLDKSIVHIEIDKHDVIDYKKEKIKSFQERGLLPQRQIHYIATDFNYDSEEILLGEIKKIKGKRPSFILIEGVLFFLSTSDTKRLFTLFDTIQGGNEFIGSVSFRKSLEKTEVFRKMIQFIENNLNKNEQFDYQTVDDDFYHSFKGYRLEQHQSTFDLAETYAPKKPLIASEVLNENMYILKKNKTMSLNLSKIPSKEIMPGYHGKLIHSENMSIAFWEVQEGAEVPEHSHMNEQIMHVLEGQFEFTLGGETKVYKENDIVIIPPHITHGGKALTPCKLMDVFSPVRAEYK